ncbi:MAG: hypothetical protein AAGG11_16015 [Pseudomonadota bacterium]
MTANAETFAVEGSGAQVIQLSVPSTSIELSASEVPRYFTCKTELDNQDDGTAAAVVDCRNMLATLVPVQTLEIPFGEGGGMALAAYGVTQYGAVYIVAESTGPNVEVWVSDGSATGTQRLTDVNSNNAYSGSLFATPAGVFFIEFLRTGEARGT